VFTVKRYSPSSPYSIPSQHFFFRTNYTNMRRCPLSTIAAFYSQYLPPPSTCTSFSHCQFVPFIFIWFPHHNSTAYYLYLYPQLCYVHQKANSIQKIIWCFCTAIINFNVQWQFRIVQKEILHFVYKITLSGPTTMALPARSREYICQMSIQQFWPTHCKLELCLRCTNYYKKVTNTIGWTETRLAGEINMSALCNF